mmetsp:Transcript_15196/g.42544  ORF Transcript_15196/g.42544 Transcript_15196/m.42544 type:complete len:401 (-) Transcript_15196:1023-2225(-)
MFSNTRSDRGGELVSQGERKHGGGGACSVELDALQQVGQFLARVVPLREGHWVVAGLWLHVEVHAEHDEQCVALQVVQPQLAGLVGGVKAVLRALGAQRAVVNVHPDVADVLAPFNGGVHGLLGRCPMLEHPQEVHYPPMLAHRRLHAGNASHPFGGAAQHLHVVPAQGGGCQLCGEQGGHIPARGTAHGARHDEVSHRPILVLALELQLEVVDVGGDGCAVTRERDALVLHVVPKTAEVDKHLLCGHDAVLDVVVGRADAGLPHPHHRRAGVAVVHPCQVLALPQSPFAAHPPRFIPGAATVVLSAACAVAWCQVDVFELLVDEQLPVVARHLIGDVAGEGHLHSLQLPVVDACVVQRPDRHLQLAPHVGLALDEHCQLLCSVCDDRQGVTAGPGPNGV